MHVGKEQEKFMLGAMQKGDAASPFLVRSNWRNWSLSGLERINVAGPAWVGASWRQSQSWASPIWAWDYCFMGPDLV